MPRHHKLPATIPLVMMAVMGKGSKVHAKAEAPGPDEKPSSRTLTSINCVRLSRFFLLFSILLSGLLAGIMSFDILKEQEHNKYSSDFDSLSHEVFIAADESFQYKVGTLSHMSTLESLRCPHVNQWPNCTVPPIDHFQAVADSLRVVSSSRNVVSCPVIWPHQKNSFEKFAYEAFEREGFPSGTGLSSFGTGIYAKYPNGSRYPDNGKTNFSEYEIFVPLFLPGDLPSVWPEVMFNMVSECLE